MYGNLFKWFFVLGRRTENEWKMITLAWGLPWYENMVLIDC